MRGLKIGDSISTVTAICLDFSLAKTLSIENSTQVTREIQTTTPQTRIPKMGREKVVRKHFTKGCVVPY